MKKEGGFSILIIDDENVIIQMLKSILSAEYTVYTATDGKDGLEQVVKHHPDLILLDIMLPDISGFEILKALKGSPETRIIPVILISGMDNEDDEEKGLLMGAVDYIVKPFKVAIVLARVKTQLQIVHQMRTIERMGLVDALTDIPNRRCFDDRLSIEWRRAVRLGNAISFLMIDVDKFKSYNDTWGHPQGDVLLKSIAGIFSAAARRSGDLAARLGGEEFGVLLPDTTIDAAIQVAEEIRQRIEKMIVPTADGVTKTHVTVSIGAASCKPDTQTEMSEFVLCADKYLYRAKNMGRNRVEYAQEGEGCAPGSD